MHPSARAFLAFVSVGLLPPPTTSAQWPDTTGPRATEAHCAALYQAGYATHAADKYTRVIASDPENSFAAYFRADSLRAAGRHEEGLAAFLDLVGVPGMTAHALYNAARCAAALGRSEEALGFLEEARGAFYPADAKSLGVEPSFAKLHKQSEFRALASSFMPAAEHLKLLAAEGDEDLLVDFWLARHHSLSATNPGVLALLGGLVDEHGEALLEQADSESRSKLAAAARSAALAADRAVPDGRFLEWVERAVRWDADAVRRHRARWKKLEGMNRNVRSHRFARVIAECKAIGREARADGDLPVQIDAHLFVGLAHLSILDYRQPRKGISKETEWLASIAEYRAAHDLARALGRIDAEVACLDYLATLAIREPDHTELPHTDHSIHEAIILSNRLAPADRELGMFEGMLVDLQKIRAEKSGRAR